MTFSGLTAFRRSTALAWVRSGSLIAVMVATGVSVGQDGPSPTPGTTSAATEAPALEQGFTSLFDGKTLTGWQGDTDGYAVEDGILFAKPDTGGNLYTTNEYSDFVFRFEFRLTPGANNGIAVRAPLSADAAYSGMEIQVLDEDHETYKGIAPYQVHGSVYGVVPAKRGHLNPTGQWNQEEIRVEGSHVTVKLNDAVIVDADVAEASKPKTIDGNEHPGLAKKTGFLGFCGHGSRVDFRNLRIETLPAAKE